jgi:hypothetical protein
MIVIGLGSGRCGTASLAHLLNAQRDAICFHEMNPSCVRFSGTPRPILNTIDEFQAILDGGDPSMLTVDLGRPVAADAYDALCRMTRVALIADIAFYYLSYVELIAAHNDRVRFVCLKRDREATVESWLRKSTVPRWRSKRLADRLACLITREPYYMAFNPWMEHDGRNWAIDPVWDKCFPKFPGPTRREAIEQYYDFYYQEAELFRQKFSDRFLMLDTEKLTSQDLRHDLLRFCGVQRDVQVAIDVHVHRSR